MATNLEKLKFNLQERQYPYFDDDELQLLLENNNNNVLKSSFKGCLLKANADDGLTIDTLKFNSNREYWLGLAEQYQDEFNKSSINISTSTTGYYPTSMKRVDGQ